MTSPPSTMWLLTLLVSGDPRSLNTGLGAEILILGPSKQQFLKILFTLMFLFRMSFSLLEMTPLRYICQMSINKVVEAV